MRSANVIQSEMLSYRTLERLIPGSHLLRKLRVLVDGILANRNGLVVDVETTLATCKADREAAAMLGKRSPKQGATLSADKNTTPPVSSRRCVSLRLRKRIEENFGWAKMLGGLRKTCFIGLANMKAQTTFTLATYNLTRIATFFGWRLNTV